MNPQMSEHTADSVRRWLRGRVSLYLQRPPDEIDPAVSLAEYDLDSVVALSLCGDIEDDFGLILEPTVAWDYPTIEALTKHLLAELRDTEEAGGVP